MSIRARKGDGTQGKPFATLSKKPKLLFRFVGGAHLYGYANKDSDIDYLEVYQPDLYDVLLRPKLVDTFVERGHIPRDHEVGVRKQPGELDVKRISLSKFLTKVSEGHMPYIEYLWGDPGLYEIHDMDLWQTLRSSRMDFRCIKMLINAKEYLVNMKDSFEQRGINKHSSVERIQRLTNEDPALFTDRTFESLAHSNRIARQATRIAEGMSPDFGSDFYQIIIRQGKDINPVAAANKDVDATPYVSREQAGIVRRLMLHTDVNINSLIGRINKWMDLRMPLEAPEEIRGKILRDLYIQTSGIIQPDLSAVDDCMTAEEPTVTTVAV